MSDGTLATPTPVDARAFVETELGEGRVVTLVGECEIEYDGRAASYLGPGERLVILKPDGTLLVHGGEGRTPVNWQPPGAAREVCVDEDALVVRAERERPAESVRVRFAAIRHATAAALAAGAEVEVTGTEADLRRRVLDEPSLIEPGFTPLATERETAAGAVDVYGEDGEGNAVVVELKRRRVGPSAVRQLAGYVDALRRDRYAGARVRGILVAPSVTDRAAALLDREGLEFVSLVPEDPFGDAAAEE